MNDLTIWLGLGLAATVLVAVLLGLRVATVRKQRAAQEAARLLAWQRQQQAAHNQALAQAHAQAEAQRLEAESVAAARQRAQAALLAQRQAAEAEREARRRAADEAARLHAQALLDKRLAERAAAAKAAARASPPAPVASAAPAAPAAPRATVQVHVTVAPALRPAPAPPLPRTRADTVVLVADDSKVVRVKLGRLLEQHGFQVMLAEDGLAALRQMQLQVPHVLLTDAEMPGLDGLELTHKVRSLPHMAHVMVLMISSADASLGDAAKAAGVTALLGKPYAEDQLLAHLDRVRQTVAASA
jgi:CheY-like chemotaxis protein